MLHLHLKLKYFNFHFNFTFLPFHHFSGTHHPERGTAFSLSNLKAVGLVLVIFLLLLWFVAFSFRKLLHLNNGREGDELHLDSKAATWWALLHSCIFGQGHAPEMEARNNSPVSSMLGAPAPAPHQCSLGNNAFLETAGPWWWLRPESWNSLLRGMKRKSFPLCLKRMLWINPAHPTQGQGQKRA